MPPIYSRGSWTPTIDSTGPAYGYREAEYRKVNDIVHVAMRMVLTKKGTGAAVSIVGLPFPTGGMVGYAYCSPIRFLNLGTAVISLAGEFNGNTIALFKQTVLSTAWTPLTVADLADNTDLRLSGTYFSENQKAD